MSDAELEKLEAEIVALQAKAKQLRSSKRASVIEELLKKITENNITQAELFPGGAVKGVRKSKSTAPAAIKYRGPNGEAWSGRGLTPKWLAAQIAQGQPKEKFAV